MNRSALLLLAGIGLAACQDQAGPVTPIIETELRTSDATALGAEAIPEQYIVVLRNDVSDVNAAVVRLIDAYGGTKRFTYSRALKGYSVRMSDAAAAAVARDPMVAYVEQDRTISLAAVQNGATYGLDRVDQRSLPLNSTYTYNADGSGVKVYIIDTGIRFDHAEFAGRASSGFDAIDGGSADDCNGHGTHVSGTVGGTTYGIAKRVALVGVRVLDCLGSGSTSGVIAGIDWVTGDHPAGAPAAANMSLGGGASTALDQAVNNSIADGVTYGVAAGNGNAAGIAQDACGYSPARTGPALTVGSTTSTDAKSSFSNFGTCVDIFAPGSSITSAWHTSATATNTISGTSMATPHVVGAAALYLQTNTAATPAQVESALESNATTGKVTGAGTGSPNLLLYTAFIGAGAPPPPPPPPANVAPVARFTWSCSGLTCSLDGSGSTDDGQVVAYNWNLGKSPDPTASGQVVSVTYPHEGPRTVVLTVTDNAGATNSVTQTITVGAPPPPPPSNTPPVAQFTWDCTSDLTGGTCSFNGSSSSDDKAVVSYAWDFGDGSTGSGVTISHRYLLQGSRSVKLTVTDAGNLSAARTCAVAMGTRGTCVR